MTALASHYGVVYDPEQGVPIVYELVKRDERTVVRAQRLGEEPFERIPEPIRALILADLQKRGLDEAPKTA